MKEFKVCSKCKINKLASEFYMKRKNELRNECKKCFNTITKSHTKSRKVIIALLGNKCVKCGSESKLEIDHVFNDGAKERLVYNGSAYLSKIKRDIDSGRYQLLCKNCHTLKSNEENHVHNPLRMAVIKLLGDQCYRCKFDNPGVLLVTSKSKVIDITNHFACDILVNPTEYELLCRNCY